MPPVGVASVAPQTEQLTAVTGRLKIVCSPEQSGHFTTQNGAGGDIGAYRCSTSSSWLARQLAGWTVYEHFLHLYLR